MKYWLISDTHFNHTKLEEWGGRSGTWQQQIWDGLGRIPTGDTLIHLGDICIGNDAEIHIQLANALKTRDGNVKMILVRGNHDGKSISWYLDHGWDHVCDGMWMTFQGQEILFSHRPMHPDMWRFAHNIHGHTHGNMHRAEEYIGWYDGGNYHIDISPEVVGYYPVRLDTILAKRKVRITE